jgi:protein SCO1/2
MSVSVPVERPASAAAKGTPAGRLGNVAKIVTKLAGNPGLWLALVALGLTVPIVTRVLRPAPPSLPVLGTLPAFALTDQEARSYGSDDLRGSVWVAGFIFTRCPTICPAITATMGRMQHRARGLGPQFRLVSFSVDPQYDTPERLAAFAGQHRASPRTWKFLTGSFDQMKQTVVDGLKISMADQAPGGDQDFASIMHGTHFVLVDRDGRIRGYYDSSDPGVVDRVLADAAMLINRGG